MIARFSSQKYISIKYFIYLKLLDARLSFDIPDHPYLFHLGDGGGNVYEQSMRE